MTFLRPTRGDRVVVEARLLRSGTNLTFAAAEIFDGERAGHGAVRRHGRGRARPVRTSSFPECAGDVAGAVIPSERGSRSSALDFRHDCAGLSPLLYNDRDSSLGSSGVAPGRGGGGMEVDLAPNAPAVHLLLQAPFPGSHAVRLVWSQPSRPTHDRARHVLLLSVLCSSSAGPSSAPAGGIRGEDPRASPGGGREPSLDRGSVLARSGSLSLAVQKPEEALPRTLSWREPLDPLRRGGARAALRTGGRR